MVVSQWVVINSPMMQREKQQSVGLWRDYESTSVSCDPKRLSLSLPIFVPPRLQIKIKIFAPPQWYFIYYNIYHHFVFKLVCFFTFWVVPILSSPEAALSFYHLYFSCWITPTKTLICEPNTRVLQTKKTGAKLLYKKSQREASPFLISSPRASFLFFFIFSPSN